MNRLTDETSPYLKQHADNPVEWHPWDEEALAVARATDRPILLSIGYSSCHWCHVMAHESFEDPATAGVMNDHFVNIKVDREERPDLDRVYQLAHNVMHRQSGGWPLTVFLDPNTHVPFFSGTYFPKQARHGLPSFVDLLMRIHETFELKRDEIAEQNDKLSSVLSSLAEITAEPTDDLALLDRAREALGEQYDPQHGGFGRAPKFPMPAALERLLHHWSRIQNDRSQKPDRDGLDMVMRTLTQMARGGIYDHVGGGFCRYATDARWMIPHFEKMLYDNGTLLGLYADALALGPDALFEGVVDETVAFLLREMRDDGGGFYASLDADSDGVEGAFYVWRKAEVKKLLDEDEYLVVETLYGLDKPANFEGKWNLHRFDAWRGVVERLYLSAEEAEQALASAKAKLFDARAERTRPGLDHKILTSWNALAIDGLVKAARRRCRDDWLDAAEAAVEFLATHATREGRLVGVWTDGEPGERGFLDDYAHLLVAILELLEARWNDRHLTFAVDLADRLIDEFRDPKGGFFFTADDHETLIHRPKPTTDDATPPGNGTAIRGLLRLGHLLAETKYLDAAHEALDWAKTMAAQFPSAHATILTALEESVFPGELVILRGPEEATEGWRRAIDAGFHPRRAIYTIPYEASRVPTYLPRLVSAGTRERVTAFVCEALTCGPPITELDEFKSRFGVS